MNIAERLKELREKKDISKKDLTDAVNIKYSTYANYESGTREPNSEVLIALANYYGVTIDYIMGREKAPTEELTAEALVNMLAGKLNRAPEVEEMEALRDIFYSLLKLLDNKSK